MNIDTLTRKIIETDYQNNHSHREYNLSNVLNVFKNIERTEFSVFKHGPVMIVYKPYTVDTVEFHCTNGGTGKDLTAAVNAFNEDMSDTYFWSITFYDNPKINELLKYTKHVIDYKKIDQGIDQTYQATFRLRSE